MRFLVTITMPNEPFGSYVKNGTAETLMQQFLGELKPDAAYFAEIRGKRTAILIVNIEQTSQMPNVAEPWFVKFDAEVFSL